MPKKKSNVFDGKYEKIMNGVATWCSFYRANPHRFCKDYLGLNLRLFQQILIVFMNISTNFAYIASRGQGKTFLIAIFCVCRCILYPKTKICIASKSRAQSINVLQKITDELIPNSANLRLEIEEVKINNQEAFISFRCGSKIKVVTANDNARGNRSNILIIDEFRMVDWSIIQTVLRRFNTSPRQPNYLKNTKNKNLIERNKEIYLSSAWYQSHWSWNMVKSYASSLVDETKKYFICGLPYQLSIEEGLLNAEQVADEMSEDTFDETAWSINIYVLLKPIELVNARCVLTCSCGRK